MVTLCHVYLTYNIILLHTPPQDIRRSNLFIYSHQATIPTALLQPLKLTYAYDNYVQELRKRFRATSQVARENVKQAKILAKKQYDKTSREKTFQVGDTVLLYDEMIRRGRSKKLELKWIGPYTVTEKYNDVNYTIKMG